jgi:glucosamine 6-phosphate synthetase-like amidotransferase/phosphosugar isomerase protein
MCGIVSICYGSENPHMGLEASGLLKRLEYRGYDSTGAAFLRDDRSILLLKRVGAPSRVVTALGIDRERGQRFIGQVRWATYGAVTDSNSQPHHVSCRIELVGAHNGNISNTDALKTSLAARGHAVVSDNDGEMLTHLVEGHYAANREAPEAVLADSRRALAAAGLPPVADGALLLMDAARKADRDAIGSYAAAFADPRVPGVVAVKSGSSLYAGVGVDAFGEFVVISSDLTSVLAKTRMLIPLLEGEGLYFTERDYLVFSLAGERAFSAPRPRRSRLNVRDTGLRPPFVHFMAQEIASAPDNLDQVLRYYFKDPETEGLFAEFQAQEALCRELLGKVMALAEAPDPAQLAAGLDRLRRDPVALELEARTRPFANLLRPRSGFLSDERQLLEDLVHLDPTAAGAARLFDLLLVWRRQGDILASLRDFVQILAEARKARGHVYLVASGTSYHAALTAANFFSSLAGFPVYANTPGPFRAAWMAGLGPDDVLIGISQSGETKDLVDVFQEVKQRFPRVRRLSLVNNENSRIPQELSEGYLPILCGPEVAVAATKSFISQLAVLYLLAASFALPAPTVQRNLARARELMQETLRVCEPGVEAVARRLCLVPSLHILGTGLIGLAREGALKIREVVLNHAEGYDAAEFKHGPNTILGRNTLFSIADLAALLDAYEAGRETPFPGGAATLKARPELVAERFANYPLVFLCGPDERDRRITISQMHTHKIRGADLVLIAEPQPDLAAAAEGRPMGDDRYWSRCIDVPACGDPGLFAFAAAVVLQRLAYRMSVLKAEYLEGLGVAEHGVHPDVPKNVSKSITVD